MEITPPEDREICRSIDFAPRGPRDCPRAISRAKFFSKTGVYWKLPFKQLGCIESI